ncbi:MAG: hypothetical protein AUG51_06210 [Acidobacteria bacterium 13_1_20CM_3_53_8]|nr:MAG: hypothetical protein AUG51_06210 [Acidobacteria bacterium 13_1_20CM_3_53_8]
MTRKILSLALGLAFAFALQGCSSSSDNTGNTATGSNATKTTTTNSATTTSSPTTASTQTASTTGGSIGVPECDEYITKYEACINQHVPEAQRAQMRAAFEQARNGWKQAAATPQGKAALAQSCKQMMDTAKQSTAAYGCQW